MKAEDIKSLTIRVTKKWAKQRKAEERSASARYRREYMYSDRVCFTDVSRELIDKGYAEVSDNDRLNAPQRNIFYAIREEFRERTDRELQWKYFAGTLLRAHLKLPHTENWKITRDPRGTLIEPHTKKEIGVGTLKIDQYLRDMDSVDHKIPAVDSDFPTCGPRHRYQALLYCEKEGFNPLFKDVKLAERFDIAIMSCKGQSVIAARKLVDEICHHEGIPLLVLHDFDKAGFEILHNLTQASTAAELADRVAYRFQNEINVVDLGLRLVDAERMNLKSERFRFKGNFDPDWNITEDEKAFLRSNRRVELNAITKSADFVAFVEEKLRGAGIKEKLIPDDDILGAAYRRAKIVVRINELIEDETVDDEDELKPPKAMRAKIRKLLKANPERSWDTVLYEIATDN